MKIRPEKLHLYEFASEYQEDTWRLAQAFAPVASLENRDISINPLFKLGLIAQCGSGKTTFFAAMRNHFSNGASYDLYDRTPCQTAAAGLIRNFDLVLLRNKKLDLKPNALGLDIIEHPGGMPYLDEGCVLNSVFDAAVSIEKKDIYDKNSPRVFQFFIPESIKESIAFDKFLYDAADFRLLPLPIEIGGNREHLDVYARRHYMFGC